MLSALARAGSRLWSSRDEALAADATISSQRFSSSKPPLAIVVGPAPGQAGGISSVMSYLQNEHQPGGEFTVTFVDTLMDGRWSLRRFAMAFTRVAVTISKARLAQRAIVAHLNVSVNGSTLRKWAVASLCSAVGVPIVVHLHSGKYPSFFANASWLMRRIVLQLFRSADRVIVLGRVWEEYVVGELMVPRSKVSVVPNGTPQLGQLEGAAPRDNAANDRVSVVFSGRLSVEKGVRDLLAASDQLHAEGINFELKLLGDCRDASLLGEAHSRSYTSLTGWLEHREVVEHLIRSDVFVLPSHDEGLPMSMIEAMSLSLPLVVTDVGSISDVVSNGNEGFLIPAGDVEGLSRAIRSLVLNQALRVRMGDAAHRRWAEGLTAARMTQRVEKEWSAALSSHSSR